MHPALPALNATGKILCDESAKTHVACTIRAMSGRLEAVNQSCILGRIALLSGKGLEAQGLVGVF